MDIKDYRYKLENHAELEAYIDRMLQAIRDLPPTQDDVTKGCRVMMRHIMPAFCRATFEMKDLELSNEEAVTTINSGIVNMFNGIISCYDYPEQLEIINYICSQLHEILTNAAKGEGGEVRFIEQPKIS